MSHTVRHEQGDHTFRNVLLFLVVAGLIIFFVDLHKEMHLERVELEIKRKQCHEDYHENECDSPV